jgi:hypothetical protein
MVRSGFCWLIPIPSNESDTNPLGIAPFQNDQIGKGWYVGNGDRVIQYDVVVGKTFAAVGA